jgi:hypothetical protein
MNIHARTIKTVLARNGLPINSNVSRGRVGGFVEVGKRTKRQHQFDYPKLSVKEPRKVKDRSYALTGLQMNLDIAKVTLAMFLKGCC